MAPHGGEKRVARVEIHQTGMPTKTLKHLFYDCNETVGQMVEELLTDELDMSMDQLNKQFELSVQLKDTDLGPDVFANMSKKRWKNETIENGGHYKVLLRGTNISSSSNVPPQLNLLELSRQLESRGIRYIDRSNHQLLNDALTANQQKDCFVLLYSQSTLADEETMDKLSLCLEYLIELVGRGKECIFVALGAQLLGDQNDDELPEAIRAIDGFPHIGVRIVKMNGDQLLTSDYVSDEIKKLGLCTARIENSQLTDGTALATGQTLLNCALPCPLSKAFKGKCPNGDFLWGCDDCGKTLAFVKQANAPIDHLFCACGRTPVEAFSFRCANVEEHGDIFRHFASKTVLTDQLVRLHKKEDLNILLMGETGIGKSTMINALLNYLKYPTMHEAIEADDVDFMIPARFNKNECKADGSYASKSVFLGEANAKERLDPTESSTTCATPYILPLKEGNKLCCVDSAGIADTGGILKDKTNFDNLMYLITGLEKLHGIAICLRPASNYASINFNYGFNEILKYMHKSAIQNIIFLFTQSRGSDFKVGNVLSLLEKELKPLEQIYGVKLLHRDRFYCVDNEAFEKLCLIKKCGVEYSKKDMENYAESWAKSEAECHRLLDYLSELPPHFTRESVSLSDARRIISDLGQPMANITSMIQKNLVNMNMLGGSLSTKQLMQRQMEKERDTIYGKAAILNAFLSSSALRAVNDSTEAYMNMSISQAEQLMAESKGRSDFEKNRDHLEAQQELLRLYKEMKKRIDQKSVSGGTQITPNDVKKIVDELCALPLFGKDIKQMYEEHQKAQQQQQRRFKDEMVYGGKDQKAKPSRNRNESNQQEAVTFDYCKQKIAKGMKRFGTSLFGSTAQQQLNAHIFGH